MNTPCMINFSLSLSLSLSLCAGLFVFDEDSRQHLFNPATFEGEEQYQLIGLLLGLAIYNNIILDIRFPVVVYRKLIGCETVLDDLFSSHGVSSKASAIIVRVIKTFPWICSGML